MGNFFFQFLIEHTVPRIHTPQVFTHTVVASVLEDFRFLFFNFQLFSLFPDQILQVARILLQNPKHGVNDIGLLPFIQSFKLKVKQKKDPGKFLFSKLRDDGVGPLITNSFL